MQNIYTDNVLLKKTWAKPELSLIGTNEITSKNRPQVRESTGHKTNIGGSSKFFLTPLNGTGLRLTTRGGATIDHISSAIS